METNVIVLRDNPRSAQSWEKLQASFKVVGNTSPLSWFEGVAADRALSTLAGLGLSWAYPLTGAIMAGGLRLSAYKGNHGARVGCALSHYLLWRECAALERSVVIAEDDFEFTKTFDPEELAHCPFDAVSLNDPRGATRRASVYHDILSRSRETVVPCPKVDPDEAIPQGLPGASCYYLRPNLARDLVELVSRQGLWPNDATLCRQLFPGRLGCLRNYVGKVSGRPSLIA